ncbi:hypothetical protein [Virgibacillus kimchii]
MKLKKLLLSIIVALLIGLSPSLNKPVAADEEISIGVSPEDTLFQVENMKPGDWAPRTVTVENRGAQDFSYIMHMENEESDKLFRELLLEITASGTALYDGKLADFENLEERFLEQGEQEELELTIRFPEELGNEYQGLNTAFTIIFTANSTQEEAAVELPGFIGSDATPSSDSEASSAGGSSGSSSGIGGTLPQTATNIFLFLILGGVLLVNGLLLYKYNQYRKRA